MFEFVFGNVGSHLLSFLIGMTIEYEFRVLEFIVSVVSRFFRMRK
jgi:hypothetical protein